MFIDFVALQLVDLVAALVLLAVYVLFFVEHDSRRVAPGFLLSGFIATVTGLYMIFTWPLPGSFNIAFGELIVLFGSIFFFAGLALQRDWDLLSIAIVSVLAGVAAIIVGIRILDLKLTQAPGIAGLGYLFTGVAGILVLPVYFWKKSMLLRIITTVVILVAAVLWAITGYASYWAHLDEFGKWLPATMHAAPPAGS